ncbi:MAG: glycoside hydrolase [Cyanobacteria bacterium]|nr:glycoside hydrolase [Cyanobacteriota bacterium]
MTSNSLSRFGKNFLVEPSGTRLTDNEKRQLEHLQPSAIMFRKRNFLENVDYDTWLDEYSKLIDELKSVIQRQSLMLSIDHEGGRVIRPPEPITRFPYAARFASHVSKVAQAMAIELKSLGINVNFAPVADIHSNPDNPVINERAFGRTAEEASQAAVAFARAMRENGIAPCAKHFPGHGDTKTDSHWGLPVIELTLDQLRRRELVPFKALVDADVPLVMTAHIMFPNIDPDSKATLSRKFLNDILREEMGFTGVVIADALGMAPTAGILRQRETVVKAINSSLDLFLVAGDSVSIENAINMAELMQESIEKGELSEESLAQSHHRIDALINNLPQHAVTKLSSEVFEMHHALAEQVSQQTAWSAFELSLPGFE